MGVKHIVLIILYFIYFIVNKEKIFKVSVKNVLSKFILDNTFDLLSEWNFP